MRCEICDARYVFVMCVVSCATFFVQFIPRPKTGTQSLKEQNVFSKSLLVHGCAPVSIVKNRVSTSSVTANNQLEAFT